MKYWINQDIIPLLVAGITSNWKLSILRLARSLQHNFHMTNASGLQNVNAARLRHKSGRLGGSHAACVQRVDFRPSGLFW